MSGTSTPTTASGAMSPAAAASGNAEGYLLLTVQHAMIKQVYDEQTMTLARGEMRLECISLPIPPTIGKQTANPFAPSPSDPAVPTHDFWLVVRVGPTFEMPVVPEQFLTPRAGADGITYASRSNTVTNAELLLTLPQPSSAADLEDLESFEVLLRQYKSLGPEETALAGIEAPALNQNGALPEGMRGRLVLINQDNGEVVGELDQELDSDDEKQLAAGSADKPVMLDFGNVIDGYAPKVKVQRVPEDEMDDWMLKGAHHISKGILSFSGWSSRMIQSGADNFVKNTKPTEKPVHFGSTAKSAIRVTHNTSVRTVNVTKTTVGMINKAITKVVETAYDKGIQPVVQEFDDARKSFDDRRPYMSQTYQAPYETRRASGSGASRPPPPTPPRSGLATPSTPPVGTKQSGVNATSIQEKIERTRQQDDVLAEQEAPPSYGSINQGGVPIAPGQQVQAQIAQEAPAKAKRSFFGRAILSAEVVLTSLEATAHELINTGTAAASSAAGHRFGPEAGHATALLGGSVRNVAVVYIDVRGIGRRALLKSSAKGFVKAKLKGGEVVQLQSEGGQGQIQEGEVEKGKDGEIVVGMAQVGLNEKAQLAGQSGSTSTAEERESAARVQRARQDLAAIDSMRD